MSDAQAESETAAPFYPVKAAEQTSTIGFRKGARLHAQAGGEDRYLGPLIDYFGDTPLEKIDQRAVDDAARILKPHAAPSTQSRQIHGPVSAIVKSCASLGLCRWRRFRRPRSRLKRKRQPDAEEARRLVLKCSPHIRPLVLLLFEGVRPGEVLKCDWSQIDLEARRVLVRRNGKLIVLKLHERTVIALTKLPHKQGRVFRTPSGREYVGDRPSIKTAFKGACRRAGIGDLSPRDCSLAGFPFNDGSRNGA